MRFLGEGLLVATVAGMFGGGATEGLIYIAADFDAGFAEGMLKGLTWQPRLSEWWLEQFLGLVILGPMVEEMVFRGVVLRRLAVRWGQTTAVIVSSVVFGLLHGEAAVPAAVFGAAMALLYFRCRTLIAPMAAHMANNLAAYLMLRFYPDDIPVTLGQLYADMGWSMLWLGLSTPAVAYYCYRFWPRGKGWPLVGSQTG